MWRSLSRCQHHRLLTPLAVPLVRRRLTALAATTRTPGPRMAPSTVDKMFIYPVDTPVQRLECKTAFEKLTDQEKRYAWVLSEASWRGALSVLVQTSPESPVIFAFLLHFFHGQTIDELRTAAAAAGVASEDVDMWVMYAAAFFGNMGNYKSFGDTKFIPQVDQASLAKLVTSSPAYIKNERTRQLWELVKGPLYSLTNREKQLGLGASQGISTYFSYNCTESDVEIVKTFMEQKGISPYNTRLFKRADGVLELRLASALQGPNNDPVGSQFVGKHAHGGTTIEVTRGDYSIFMHNAAKYLQLAKDASANDHEREMLAKYASSFETGSIRDHIDGSRAWIKDKGPIVESYIGFIESYRSPCGTRGEFEGFVAVVNKDMSSKFQTLVDRAESILSLMPWPKPFEKDKFLRPDFTSLDVLTYAGSGIPAGINIPNYDEVRQNEGFKNVSLGNVLAARNALKDQPCLSPTDIDIFRRLQGPAFEVQVGLHELLGHGSGKLMMQKEDGSFNFDDALMDHVHTQNIKAKGLFYKPGETYDSVFTSMGSAYEECRAEAVGIYLCLDRDVLKVFGHTDTQEQDDIIYANWLLMVRAGLMALEFYTPETKTWRQAHMHARHVILRVLLEASQGLVEIVKVDQAEDGKPDVYCKLDRSKIKTIGKAAMETFLSKLQVYKSTANIAKATEFFGSYSTVDDDMLALRPIVLQRQRPRPLFAQAVVKQMPDGQIALVEPDSSPAGLVQSFVERFGAQSDDVEALVDIAQKDAHYFV